MDKHELESACGILNVDNILAPIEAYTDLTTREHYELMKNVMFNTDNTTPEANEITLTVISKVNVGDILLMPDGYNIAIQEIIIPKSAENIRILIGVFENHDPNRAPVTINMQYHKSTLLFIKRKEN